MLSALPNECTALILAYITKAQDIVHLLAVSKHIADLTKSSVKEIRSTSIVPYLFSSRFSRLKVVHGKSCLEHVMRKVHPNFTGPNSLIPTFLARSSTFLARHYSFSYKIGSAISRFLSKTKPIYISSWSSRQKRLRIKKLAEDLGLQYGYIDLWERYMYCKTHPSFGGDKKCYDPEEDEDEEEPYVEPAAEMEECEYEELILPTRRLFLCSPICPTTLNTPEQLRDFVRRVYPQGESWWKWSKSEWDSGPSK